MLTDVRDKMTLDQVMRAAFEQAKIDELITGYNVAQLWSGETAQATPIQPQYTPRTKRIKRGKGQPYDRVTLKDTGDFHASIYSYVDGRNDIVIDAKDSKKEKLVTKYTAEIFGLKPNNMEQFRLVLLNAMRDHVLHRILQVQ